MSGQVKYEINMHSLLKFIFTFHYENLVLKINALFLLCKEGDWQFRKVL